MPCCEERSVQGGLHAVVSAPAEAVVGVGQAGHVPGRAPDHAQGADALPVVQRQQLRARPLQHLRAQVQAMPAQVKLPTAVHFAFLGNFCTLVIAAGFCHSQIRLY